MSPESIMEYSVLAKRWSGFHTSVFTEMTELSNSLKAVNLAQGFPDFPGPQRFRDLLTQHMTTSHLQYAPCAGDLILRTQLANWIGQRYEISYDPDSEITITCGATEALYCAINAVVNPGDRVAMFEPFFDCYAQGVAQAGGEILPIRLHAPNTPLGLQSGGGGQWAPDWEQFDAACAGGFKLFIFNAPHNPTGRIFSADELERIAQGVVKSGALVITDEVYEGLSYAAPHQTLAAHPLLRNRVMRISSAAKTFGFTGVKSGWVCAAPALTKAIRLVHQATIFCIPPPLQSALAELLSDLNWVERHIEKQRLEYASKRDFLSKNLKQAGFKVSDSPGAYFVMASYENLAPTLSDVEFAKHLVRTKRVATIPPSVFYKVPPKNLTWVRFAFCKKQETLEEAARLLNS
jgi:aspartate/methionine/tyrosine aminotransferase